MSEYTTIAKLISRAANKVNDGRAALVVRVGARVVRVSEEPLTRCGRASFAGKHRQLPVWRSCAASDEDLASLIHERSWAREEPFHRVAAVWPIVNSRIQVIRPPRNPCAGAVFSPQLAMTFRPRTVQGGAP